MKKNKILIDQFNATLLLLLPDWMWNKLEVK
jgi:hypothetical protein